VAQRYPHFAVLGLSCAALVARPARAKARDASRRSPLFYASLVAATALAYLVGAGYAAFHVGVESGYFGSGCAATGAAGSIEELRERLEAAPLVRCDEVAWTLFGVSMAGWNGIVSVVLGAAAGYAAVRAALASMKRADA
jgi:disulfide bond formation protein DsbB